MWRSHINGTERKDAYRNSREGKRESNNSYRDRTQREKDGDKDRNRNRDREKERERDRDHRDSRRDYPRKDDEKQEGRKKHERSPRRENNHSKHREYNERSRSGDRSDYKRKRDNQYKRRKNSEEIKVKKKPSPTWGKPSVKNEAKLKSQQEKEKPNFELSGKLTEDVNTVNGVVIKYSEPQDARKPKRRWRLYPFKGEKALPTLYIHRQSAYLMGRDRKVADIPLDHPSCSKQHAALQYRLVSYQKDGGVEGRRIRPYLIDLDSANGTFVNNTKLEPRRYHGLLERDVLRFGFSSREYVLLHEHSKDDSLDDDVPATTTT